jgi:formylglycine-generating enzyme required for sulfatase activity
MNGTRNSGLWGFALIVIVGCSLSATGLAVADGPPVQWQKTFGGSYDDYGWSVQQTTDGGYVIAGDTLSFGAVGRDVYLIKTDPNGNMQWEKTFGESYDNGGYSVQQTTDGGYIIAGYTSYLHPDFNEFMYSVYLIKTEPNGTKQWQKTFGGFEYSAFGVSVQQTTDGGYIIAGGIQPSPRSYSDVYLVKTEPNGTKQWQKTFGGIEYTAYGSSVQQTSDGGYIIAGQIRPAAPSGYTNVYLVKTEPNGTKQWQKTFGGFEHSAFGYSVQQTSDGGYIIVGVKYEVSGGEVYLIKTDPNGNSDWEKTFGGNYHDLGNSVRQTKDGGYIIAGCTESFGAGRRDVYLIKTDPNGNSQWEKTFGGVDRDFGEPVQQTSDGGYVIAGRTISFGAGDYDVYLIKLCSEGTLSGDLNCDGTIDAEDLDILVSQWLQPRSISQPHTDIYGVGDGIANFKDFAVMASQWLTTDPCVPDDMAYISEGEFDMGDHLGDGFEDELPIHAVFLGGFFMSKYETTNQQYCDYLNDAYSLGQIKVVSGRVYAYSDGSNSYPYCDTSGSSPYSQVDYNNVSGTFSVRTKGEPPRDMSDDPMVMISWYGAAAYCNWRSQQEGKEQCYNLSTWTCDFSRHGYRLATEAEWEYAARGGEQSPYYRFPWGDTISHSQSNYYSDSYFSYDVSPTRGYHPAYNDGIYPYTAPVGSLSANGYGLYDMSGNVGEWCNDWYNSIYYSTSPYDNPQGPASGSFRVLRGGCWYYFANFCRVAVRIDFTPGYRYRYFGFRVVLDLE